MKRIILFLFGLLIMAGLTAQPVTVPTLGPRFKQTRERADILLKNRDGTYPLPDPKFILFQAPPEAAAPVAVLKDTPIELPAESDETLLNEAALLLKKGGGGIVTLANGRMHLTFNQKVFNEGDLLSVPLRTRTVDVQIKRILNKSVILGLNESEAVWRF